MNESLPAYLGHLPGPLPQGIAILIRIFTFFIFLFKTTTTDKAFGHLTSGVGTDCGQGDCDARRRRYASSTRTSDGGPSHFTSMGCDPCLHPMQFREPCLEILVISSKI